MTVIEGSTSYPAHASPRFTITSTIERSMIPSSAHIRHALFLFVHITQQELAGASRRRMESPLFIINGSLYAVIFVLPFFCCMLNCMYSRI